MLLGWLLGGNDFAAWLLVVLARGFDVWSDDLPVNKLIQGLVAWLVR